MKKHQLCTFKYKGQNDESSKERIVFVLTMKQHMRGIDVSNIPNDERSDFCEKMIQYQQALSEHIASFGTFSDWCKITHPEFNVPEVKYRTYDESNMEK